MDNTFLVYRTNKHHYFAMYLKRYDRFVHFYRIDKQNYTAAFYEVVQPCLLTLQSPDVPYPYGRLNLSFMLTSYTHLLKRINNVL